MNAFIQGCKLLFRTLKWDKVFKSGLCKFCRRQPLKNLKGYVTCEILLRDWNFKFQFCLGKH